VEDSLAANLCRNLWMEGQGDDGASAPTLSGGAADLPGDLPLQGGKDKKIFVTACI